MVLIERTSTATRPLVYTVRYLSQRVAVCRPEIGLGTLGSRGSQPDWFVSSFFVASPHSYYGRLNGSAAAASSSAASAFRRFEEPPTWLLIRSSAAALETFLPQQAIGLISMLPVPGAPGCWLARFISPAAAMDTARYLANIVGHVEPISERDAQRLVGLDAGNIINKM